MGQVEYIKTVAEENAEKIRKSGYYEEYFLNEEYSEEDKNNCIDVYDCLLTYCITQLDSNVQYDFDIDFDSQQLFV